LQHVERERRFPGAGDASDDDELVMEDRDADIFEVGPTASISRII